MTVNNRNCVRFAQGSDPFAKERALCIRSVSYTHLSQMKTGGIMMAGITIAGILLTYLWFHYYEGKRMED